MYYRARWYDSASGRFISEDPIGLAGGINLYGYVGNDPLNRTDPTGHIGRVMIGGSSAALINASFQYLDISNANINFKNRRNPNHCIWKEMPTFDWGQVANAFLAGSGASGIGRVFDGGYLAKFASGFLGQIGANSITNFFGLTNVDPTNQAVFNGVGEIIGPAGNRFFKGLLGATPDELAKGAVDNVAEFCENAVGDIATSIQEVTDLIPNVIPKWEQKCTYHRNGTKSCSWNLKQECKRTRQCLKCNYVF